MGEVEAPRGPIPWSKPTLWWGVAALTASIVFGLMGVLAWSQPQDGTDAAGMLALSLFALAMLTLPASLTLIAFAAWRRRHPPRQSATPMWHPDPWRQAQWRFWNGDHWTHFVA